MLLRMLLTRENGQIFDPVVELVSVNVMHLFGMRKQTPYVCLHDEPVLSNVAFGVGGWMIRPTK